MDSEVNPVWREWLPLSGLLDQLPQQFQRGLGAADLQLTCLATLPQHLVLGTNVGLVYLAHLPSVNLMRLKCENHLSPVSSVASVRTVDDMIAAGTVDGTITIFQLPRVTSIPGAHSSFSSNSGILRSKGMTAVQPSVKRFTVGNIHNVKITSLTWSRNGMRLFSGDAEGVVSVVDINYQTSECTARKLLKETSSITQLSYIYQHLAVSTLERALIYSLAEGRIQQVGQKPRRCHGLFGCVWSPSATCSDAVLYTSRPGLRFWSATSEGNVLLTHIIKELPEKAKALLLNPSFEKPKEGEKFSFGLLYMLDESHIVSCNPHWLFVIDVKSSKVLTFTGQFRHITGIAASGQEIFVLEGSRNVACLSIEPLDIGKKQNPSLVRSNPFPETQNLRDIGSRIVTRGTGLFEQIARVSSSVAAKVSEHTNPSIIIGKEIRNNQQQACPSPQLFHRSEQDTSASSSNIGTKRQKHGHQRSSSSGVVPENEQFMHSSSPIHPRMVHSVSSLIPAMLSSPMLITGIGKTPPLISVNIAGEEQVVEDYEEIVTSSQIVAQEGAETEPLVLRDKSKKKARKKDDFVPSPDSSSENSCKSTSDISDTPNSETSSSPSVEPHQCSALLPATKFSKMSNVAISMDTEPTDEANVLLTDERQMENSESVSDDGVDENERLNCEATGERDSTTNLGFETVDTRTYDDFKSDIQQKESLLAEILDLGCLKMDHEIKMKDHESEATGNSENYFALSRECSFDSTGCSTPSTLKELSPAPDCSSNIDFYAQYYPGDHSIISVDSSSDAFSHKEAESSSTIEDNSSLVRNEEVEHLLSNLSEDRHSCLSYGPPSGSSLLSLGSRPQAEGQEQSVNDSKEMLTVTDSSEVADVSWSYSASDIQECHEYDAEEMTGGWTKYKLPSNIMSLAVSENTVGFVDRHGCLFFQDFTSKNKAWRKVKLTAKATAISISPNGCISWIQFGTNVYAIQNPSPETLSSCKMRLVAKNVQQMCVDEDLTWYINEENQVCAQRSWSSNSQFIVQCKKFQMVKVVSRNRVIWGLTDQGQLVFRIGVTAQSPAGHEWGVMETHGTPVVDVALGPGHKGWIVNTKGKVYFRLGVCVEYPQGCDSRWWQVVTSDYMMECVALEPGNVMLAPSLKGIWLAEQGTNYYSFHSSSCTGHVWSVFSKDVWSTICAEGLYTDQGAICCLSPEGLLFVINPNTASSVPFDVPNNEYIMSVSQRPEAMWVLTSAGNIYIRVGLSANSLHGSHWEALDLNQIGDIHMCHLSCGMEVVWGVDTRGGVYMRQGPLNPSPTESLPPAWIQVDPIPLRGNAVFTKVFVGMKLHMVWAVDSCFRVYVREAIFPELPIGLSWVHVGGLFALHLSISENEVYALTPNGEVFKRTGVTETNYIGDAWEKIPGNLARISVTTDNCLWGLNSDGNICQHEVYQDSDLPAEAFTRSQTLSISSETSDWEVL